MHVLAVDDQEVAAVAGEAGREAEVSPGVDGDGRLGGPELRKETEGPVTDLFQHRPIVGEGHRGRGGPEGFVLLDLVGHEPGLVLRTHRDACGDLLDPVDLDLRDVEHERADGVAVRDGLPDEGFVGDVFKLLAPLAGSVDDGRGEEGDFGFEAFKGGEVEVGHGG